MSVVEDTDPEGLRGTNYPRFRILTGGKGPPELPEKNWLADLVPGTTFVARDRNSKEVDSNLYHVLFISLPEVVLLKWELPDGKLLDYYVDPERFSKRFELRKILGIIKQEHHQDAEGVKDGCNEQRDQGGPSNLVLHASVQGEHQLVSGSEEPEV